MPDKHQDPKTLWDELLRAFHGWMNPDEDEGEQAQDPSLMFHLLFTVPLLIGLYTMMTRHA